ncbi:hypothetical protein [uncultured Campylobacter sp.]|uniref:hypothetical protein n=1 Tax=uncultured Campylobacter sp. TaxID=218934 RepID=UPI00260C16EC|nr:hypothetical protein [uncultured Campylobacter sp.]
MLGPIHAVGSGKHYGAASGLEIGRRRAIVILREIKSVKFKRKMIRQEDGA